jgi:cysteine desulfurase
VVAVQMANNETGVLQPLAEVAARTRRAGVPLVVDAVQAAGKIDLTGIEAEAVALSAHKFGGPQGVGALVLRGRRRLAPLIAGGGQERGLRGGTPNVPGIAGFGAAATEAGHLETAAMAALRDRLEGGIAALAPAAEVFGRRAPRLPNTTCLRLPGVGQQRQVMALDLAGVAVSAGAACSSGKVTPSHVLRAMGVGETAAREAIRVSLGWATTAADIDAFLSAWAPLAGRAAGP